MTRFMAVTAECNQILQIILPWIIPPSGFLVRMILPVMYIQIFRRTAVSASVIIPLKNNLSFFVPFRMPQ